MLGRRGPAQAAFTPPELQELGELAGADVVVDPADLELDPASARRARGRPRDRAAQLRPAAGVRGARAGGQADARCGCASSSRRSRSWARAASRRSRSSATSSSPATTAGSAPCRPSELEVIPCGIVLRSVGYRGVPLPGRAVPRGARRDPERGRPRGRRRRRGRAGRLRRRLDQARPERRDRHEQEGRDRDGRAAARGRARRAALPRRRARRAREPARCERGVQFVEYAGWEAIDRHERARGEPHGRPRVKLATWDELLAAAPARAGVAQRPRLSP